MTQTFSLSRIHFPVTTLGPGRRIGIWFQGCSIRCTGCISMDTWAGGGMDARIDDVLDFVRECGVKVDGVTITGGEPFDQPEAILPLLHGLRDLLRPGADILVFSGYPADRLVSHLKAAEGLIDALISDPFDVSAPQTLALRGSDNQRLHLLTPLGHERFGPYERIRGEEDDLLDFAVDEGGTVWMAGIPRRGDLERLRLLLEAEGALAWTSEHRVTEAPAECK